MSSPISTPSAFALLLLLAAQLILLALTGVLAGDRLTWLLEVFPVLLGLPVLYLSWRCFPLTSLLYGLLFVHAVVLMVGGTYTYAKVPLGFWLQDALELARNPYDRIGHLLQGLVPALIAREILLRGGYLPAGRMLAFLCLCVVMLISSCYELIEWAAAVLLGQGASEFLGTQGDPWDTQADMLMALIGGSAALLLLARWQDRQLEGLLRPGSRRS